MPLYRRLPGKPVECLQFHFLDAWPNMVGRDEKTLEPYVTTIHGQRAFLADGDWIMPEPDGKHFYPCKPDIFAATYELALPSG